MRIKLLVSRAGPDIVQNRGDEIDVEDDEAIRMIDAEQAVPVRAVEVETAVSAAAPEKAGRKVPVAPADPAPGADAPPEAAAAEPEAQDGTA